MNERHHLRLDGCTPEPLMHYLKALGVLRLVASHAKADPGVQGYWQGDTFCLATRLDREELLAFFLDQYQPTPVLAPWNGGSGFWDSTAAGKALAAIIKADSPRLTPYRTAIAATQAVIAQQGLKAAPKKEAKVTFLRALRSTLPDEALEWLDAAAVLTETGTRFAPVLGTGGNDGRLDFTSNFMQRLGDVLPLTGEWAAAGRKGKRKVAPDRQESRTWLAAALFASDHPPLLDAVAGQFNPGGTGGANAAAGFGGGALVNPWDFILMIEGALLLAGAAARRFGSDTRSKAAFPFTVDASSAGWGTLSDSEEQSARAEIWLPLWREPASFGALQHLFSEGRAEFGRRQAHSGLDFARAVASLGVAQGIDQFQRFGLVMRNGLAYLAAPLGRLVVRERSHVRLIDEADPWLNRLRQAAEAGATGSIQRAVREIDRSIFAYCAQGSPERLQDVLIALGRAEAEIGRSRNLQEMIRMPLQHLSQAWLTAADDGSAEFRLAVAAASIDDPAVGPIRQHWEPVRMEKRRLVWRDPSEGGTDPAFLVPALLSVLERRLMEGSRRNLDHLPIGGHASVSLVDLHRFLTGGTDDERIGELLRGLATIRWGMVQEPIRLKAAAPGTPLLNRAYALIKLLFLPKPLQLTESVQIRPEPRVLPLLRANRLDEAVAVAIRRLRASQLAPVIAPQGMPSLMAPLHDPHRLGAALLFPVTGIKDLVNMTLQTASAAR